MTTRIRDADARKPKRSSRNASTEPSPTPSTTDERREHHESHREDGSLSGGIVGATGPRGAGSPTAASHPLLRLQRSHGNAAVQHLLRSDTPPEPSVDRSLDGNEDEDETSGRTVDRPADVRAGTSVEPTGTGPGDNGGSEDGGTADRTATKGRSPRSPARSGDPDDLAPTVASALNSRGRGRPLPTSMRRDLEGWFDHRFDDVRVHAGAKAATAARDLDAAAFTRGTDVYVRGERFRPVSEVGRHVLLHELTHVVQQRRSGRHASSEADGSVSNATDPTEREARRVTRTVERGESPQVYQTASPETVHRFELRDLTSSIGSAVSSAANSVVETGAGVVRGTVELVESGAQAVLEVGRDLVDRFAPGLLDFLQDPGARISEVLCAGVDALISGALSTFERFEPVGELESSTVTGTATVQPAAEAAGGGADRLVALLEPVVGALQQYGLPVLHSVQGAIETVRETFASVWQAVAQPAADFLSEAGGAVWDGLVTLGTRVWELVEPLWRGIQGIGTRAWEWVQEQFGIAWESSEDSRNWIVERATELWESLKSAIAPVIETIQSVVETITSASSEVITAVEEAVTPLWEKLTWLWENWSADDVLVRAQGFLREQLLPSVLAGVDAADRALSSAVEWVTDIVGGINGRVQELVGAVDIGGCLQSVGRVATFVSEQFARFAEWARSGLGGLMNGIRSGLTSVADFLRPVLEFLFKLATVVANPLGLPALLFSELWARIPDRLKPPIVTFLVELLITFVRGASLLASGLGPLASIVEETVVGFLVRVRDAADQVKIDASNRIARLLGGGSLDFVGGFLWGVLKGLWEGLTDPFKLIYMLVKAGVGATRYLYNLLVEGGTEVVRRISPGETGADEPLIEAPTGGATAPSPEASLEPTAGQSPEGPVTAAAPDGTVVPPSPTSTTASSLRESAASTAGVEEQFLASQERAASQENATPEGLFGLLSSVWNQVLGKAKEIGASLAEALLGYLSLPDFELGDKLGSLAGMVLFEVLLNALTAFAYSAVSATRSVLRVIVRLLDVGGEIFGGLMKLLGKIRGPVTSALGGLGRFLEKIPGLRTVWEKVSNAFRSAFRYTDEAASAGRGTRRAGAETAEEAGERVAKEAMEETSGLAGRGSAPATGRASSEVGEMTGERAKREADDTVDGRRDGAAKAIQYHEAVAAARSITDQFDRLNAPSVALNAALNALRRRYRWIDRFEVRPKRRPGQYAVYMIASEHPIDTNVDLAEEEETLPEGGISIEERSALGGRIPGYARDRPGAYYYDTNVSRYKRRPGASKDPAEAIEEVTRSGKRRRKSSLRTEHRVEAAKRLQESIRSGWYDPASLRTAQHLGPDQLDEIAEAETVEELLAAITKHDLEFHHAPRLADQPHEWLPGPKSGLTPRPVHRQVEHGDDFQRPLEMGEPAAPEGLTTREPSIDPEDALQSILSRGPIDEDFAESFGWRIIEAPRVDREEILSFLRNTDRGQAILGRLIAFARTRSGTSRQQLEFLERLRR